MTPSLPFCPDGPVVSRFVAGMWRLADWQFSVSERQRYIEACLDMGVNTFDHADIYGNYACEQLFGEVLGQHQGLRQRIVLISKCDVKLTSSRFPERRLNHYDTSAAHIIASAEASLQNLNTSELDVLLLHRPDPLLDADEVAQAFVQLRDAGKVKHFGVSNFTPSQFELLQSRLSFPLFTNQVECSVLNFEVMHDGTLDQAQRHRFAPMAWSPLGGGRLFHDDSPQSQRVRSTMQAIGEAHGGASLDQIAFAWLLRHPAKIIPVLGTQRTDRIERALAASSINLSREDWFDVWRASIGHDVP